MEQQMRDLSGASDSSGSSSASPPQELWAPAVHGTGVADASTGLHLSSMMYPFSSQFGTASTTTNSSATSAAAITPLQTSTAFDFTSASAQAQAHAAQAQQYNNLYQAYSQWNYSGYGFPNYTGMYGSGADFKDVALPATAGSSAASTPSAVGFEWTHSNAGKKKRQPYKKDQISRLEYEYSTNQYLNNKRRAELSRALVLDEKQIKVWFQNRRMKEKKIKQRVAGPFLSGALVTPCYE